MHTFSFSYVIQTCTNTQFKHTHLFILVGHSRQEEGVGGNDAEIVFAFVVFLVIVQELVAVKDDEVVEVLERKEGRKGRRSNQKRERLQVSLKKSKTKVGF